MAKPNILDKLAEAVDKLDTSSKKEESKPKKAQAGAATAKPSAKKEEKKSPLMEELLGAEPLSIPSVGDVIAGKVIEITSSAIYLDLGVLGTGVVLGREIKDGMGASKSLKPGDSVQASVMELENEDGYIELSIREASYEKAWDDLESKRDTQEVLSTKILAANKGGLMVEINGITGFLPVSQLSSEHYPRVEDGDKNKIFEHLKRFAGTEMTVRIIDTEREGEKLIVSEKAAMSEKERKSISTLKVGDIIDGEASGVVDFGAFVKFFPPGTKEKNESEKLEGLVHISELAWQLIDNPRDIIKAGDKVKAKIISIDDTRISLSMRALEVDPWTKVKEKYKVGDTVDGKVTKINPFGAFVYLDEDIHGLAHVSDLRAKFPRKNIEEILKAGETYKWKILSLEPEEHRMGLELMEDKK